MARCSLCNDLEVGSGELLHSKTWVANILNSACLYCRHVVKCLEELEPDYLSQDYYGLPTVSPDLEQDADVKINLEVPRHGHLYINTHEEDWVNRDVSLELFRLPEDKILVDSCSLLEVPVRGEISSLPGDPSLWAFLRSSLRECLETHTVCRES